MDIRRQTAHELTSGATTVPDGRSSGHHNRVSAAAINHKIGRTSVTSGSAAIDSLTALAARNDMAVGLNQNAPSIGREKSKLASNNCIIQITIIRMVVSARIGV